MFKFLQNLLSKTKQLLSGNFLIACQFLLWESEQLDARVVDAALTQTDVDLPLLIEVICTKTRKEIERLKENYQKSEYKKHVATNEMINLPFIVIDVNLTFLYPLEAGKFYTQTV